MLRFLFSFQADSDTQQQSDKADYDEHHTHSLQLCPDLAECLVHILSTGPTNNRVSNVALAVRYECIQTIFSIDTRKHPILTEKAVETLSAFLSCPDSNNGRYVALNLLLKSEKKKKFLFPIKKTTLVSSVQSCLSDTDSGIVAKAIDVVFSFFLVDNALDLSYLLDLLMSVVKRFFSTEDNPIRIVPSSIANLPKKLLSVFDNKYSCSSLNSREFVDFLFDLLNSLKMEDEEIVQLSLSILSRHLAQANADLQRYAVHRSVILIGNSNFTHGNGSLDMGATNSIVKFAFFTPLDVAGSHCLCYRGIWSLTSTRTFFL